MEVDSLAAADANATVPTFVGYVAAGISCFFFGSNLLPVKNYEVGDGKS